MRLRSVASLLTLAGAVTTSAAVCSNGSRRDQNYGSDAGADYHPPEAGVGLDAADAEPADVTTDVMADGVRDGARD
jgi:hypothetical protein